MTEQTFDGYPAYLVCKIDLVRDSPDEDSLNVSTSMVEQEKVVFPTLKEYRLFTIGNSIFKQNLAVCPSEQIKFSSPLL